jgi:DNA/RNA-binding domain of Phe-tRNA-synthetase-like protein
MDATGPLLIPSEAWQKTYPIASMGVLAMGGIDQPKKSPELNSATQKVETELRERFTDRAVIKQHPAIQAYTKYYKDFGNTYHVLAQVESVALKGKSIPRISPIVQAMFTAELKNMLLTAVHDLDAVETPLCLDVAKGDEELKAGKGSICKAGDMYVADQQGVISVIIYGADDRTRVGKTSGSALFTTYGVEGVAPEAVKAHLEDMQGYIKLFAPQAVIHELKVYTAG